MQPAGRGPHTDPGCGGGDAALGRPGDAHGAGGNARRRDPRAAHPRGRHGRDVVRLGQPRRGDLRFRRRGIQGESPAESAHRLRLRRALLCRLTAGPTRGPSLLRGVARAIPRAPARRRRRPDASHDGARRQTHARTTRKGKLTMYLDFTPEERELRAESPPSPAVVMTPEDSAIIAGIMGGNVLNEGVRAPGDVSLAMVRWAKELRGRRFNAVEQFIFFEEAQRVNAPIPLVT